MFYAQDLHGNGVMGTRLVPLPALARARRSQHRRRRLHAPCFLRHWPAAIGRYFTRGSAFQQALVLPFRNAHRNPVACERDRVHRSALRTQVADGRLWVRRARPAAKVSVAANCRFSGCPQGKRVGARSSRHSRH